MCCNNELWWWLQVCTCLKTDFVGRLTWMSEHSCEELKLVSAFSWKTHIKKWRVRKKDTQIHTAANVGPHTHMPRACLVIKKATPSDPYAQITWGALNPLVLYSCTRDQKNINMWNELNLLEIQHTWTLLQTNKPTLSISTLPYKQHSQNITPK